MKISKNTNPRQKNIDQASKGAPWTFPFLNPPPLKILTYQDSFLMHKMACSRKFLNIWLLYYSLFEGSSFIKIKNLRTKLFAKSIFTSILKVLDKFIEKYRRSRNFGDWHLAKMAFWDMGIFVGFSGKMVHLGLIDF